MEKSESGYAKLGRVPLHTRDTVGEKMGEDIGENIVAHLPSRPIYPGTTFEVDVYAQFNHLLETFTIDFGVGDAMTIKQFALASGGGWSGTTANTGRIATLSYLRDSSGLTKAGGQEKELLATMKVQVSNDAPVDSLGSVSVIWSDTSNVLDETVAPDDKSMIVGRHGRSRDGSGNVHIEENALRAVFGAAESSALVNTAVLDGKPVTTNLDVVGVHASGAFRNVASSDLVCVSADTKVLLANCQQIQITEEQVTGSPRVEVSVTHARTGLSTAVLLSVWAPTLPIKVSLVDSRLQAVRGWYDSEDCRLKYQRTAVVAKAVFTTSDPWVTVFEADVSDTIAQRLTIGTCTHSFHAVAHRLTTGTPP